MQEHYTEALVLDKEDLGDYDSRVFLYSKDLGKVSAKATSVRKITSKLAAHLEPGNLINVRLVQKNSFQIADALKVSSLPKSSETMRVLNLVKELAPEGDRDQSLWEFLILGEEKGEEALRILGFDKEFAVCDSCGAGNPRHFLLRELDYRCALCLVKSGRPASFALK